MRVEGAPNTRILIGDNGGVAILGDNMLFLNFGDFAIAEDFLAKRIAQGMPGATLKSFEVPKSFLDELRATAVLENQASANPGAPLIVDINKGANQFGLRIDQINRLNELIIQGSGRNN